MAAALDQTNTSVECGYCLKQNENMKMPKLLPCGHIHCSGCLDGILDAQKIVECPDCKQVLNVPIHSLSDAQIGTQNPQYFCDVCEKPATIYCSEAECKKKYCPEHKKHHDALLSKHKFISIAEFSLRSKQEEKRTCSVHEGQVLSFGCRRCSDILCEDCIDEEGACSGSWHRPVHLRKLHGEVKEKIELLKTKVEERKDVLLFLSKESDRVLTEYGEETEKMVKLIHNTRDDQLKEINAQYESLEKKFNEKRQEMEDNIVHFKDDVVESELSHLNTILQRMLASLKQDHLVDVIRNSKQAESQLNNGLAKELPALRITEATGLTIKESQLAINAEVTKIMYDVLIGQLSDSEPDLETRNKSKVPEKEGESTLVMQQMDNLKPDEEEEETVVKWFEQIYYEFMKIIHAKDLTSKILEQLEGTLTESTHPDNDQLIIVTVKSYIPGVAERMMDALLELFYDVTKSVYSHSIKLNYDGDKQELAKALVDQLQDPRYGFIARLSTNDEIRIIGSPANKDKDVLFMERLVHIICHYFILIQC
ncbi:transcription intermediary factor 1-beta-like [Watersipora subatra]|uniref:transcription intermediary factor 1-beta-like n=1 Tax=Watersipora subatra TaxID=2589382 RepID=UPI00355C673A